MNPAYDPSVYTNFNPQDAVQQYIQQHGAPLFPPTGAYTEAFIPTYENFLVPAISLEPKRENNQEGVLTGLGPVVSTLVKIAAKIGM